MRNQAECHTPNAFGSVASPRQTDPAWSWRAVVGPYTIPKDCPWDPGREGPARPTAGRQRACARIRVRSTMPRRAYGRGGSQMRQSPATRLSLLIRLRDPADGPAWEEFVEIYAPLIRRLAAPGVAGRRRRGPRPGDPPGGRARHPAVRPRPGAGRSGAGSSGSPAT